MEPMVPGKVIKHRFKRKGSSSTPAIGVNRVYETVVYEKFIYNGKIQSSEK
jgi:hypothetical protein